MEVRGTRSIIDYIITKKIITEIRDAKQFREAGIDPDQYLLKSAFKMHITLGRGL